MGVAAQLSLYLRPPPVWLLLVGLSASMPHHLRSAREAIACLRAEFDEARPAVLLGGLAINQFSPLATMLGADATGPDARSAMEAAAQLVPSP